MRKARLKKRKKRLRPELFALSFACVRKPMIISFIYTGMIIPSSMGINFIQGSWGNRHQDFMECNFEKGGAETCVL